MITQYKKPTIILVGFFWFCCKVRKNIVMTNAKSIKTNNITPIPWYMSLILFWYASYDALTSFNIRSFSSRTLSQFLDNQCIYTLQEFNKYIVKPDYEVITKLLKSKDDVA